MVTVTLDTADRLLPEYFLDVVTFIPLTVTGLLNGLLYLCAL